MSGARRGSRLAIPAVAGLGALAAATAAIALLALAAGAEPGAALLDLLRGSVLTRGALGETLARATPLLFCALGAVVALRAGFLNVGLEGQFLAGAAAAAAVGPVAGLPPLAAAFAATIAAAAAGALWVLPASWLAERRRVPEVLSTILLNLLAGSLVTWLVRGPLRDPSGDYPQTTPLPDAVLLSPLVSGWRVTVALPAALVLVATLTLLLYRTRAGLVLRAAGESPRALRAAGWPDAAVRVAAAAASGALAGLAGGLEVLGSTGRLYDPFSGGIGYLGIAAALLGATNPLGAATASLALAALGAGAGALQRNSGVPASLAQVVPAVAVLVLLSLLAFGRRAERPA